jgi:uncharacterized membrane protein
MPDPTTSLIAHTYLVELESALTGLSPETRNGILSGIREELDGLGDADASRRIQELGDPEFIASEARAEAAVVGGDTSPVKRSPKWFAIVAALLVMVGGFVIPILGTIAGLVMVWFSETWSRKEKLIATVTPVAIVILLLLAGTFSSLWQAQQAQPNGQVSNPVIPASVDLVTSSVLLVLVVQLGVGVWLLVRAKRAWSTGPSSRQPPEG